MCTACTHSLSSPPPYAFPPRLRRRRPCRRCCRQRARLHRRLLLRRPRGGGPPAPQRPRLLLLRLAAALPGHGWVGEGGWGWSPTVWPPQPSTKTELMHARPSTTAPSPARPPQPASAPWTTSSNRARSSYHGCRPMRACSGALSGPLAGEKGLAGGLNCSALDCEALISLGLYALLTGACAGVGHVHLRVGGLAAGSWLLTSPSWRWWAARARPSPR